MLIKSAFAILVAACLSFILLRSNEEIPIELLSMDLETNVQGYSKTVLENEISGIQVDHITIMGEVSRDEVMDTAYRYIYLFIKGNGKVIADDKEYEIVPETIFLPNALSSITILSDKLDTLNFIKIASELTEQDLLDLAEFPQENTQVPYYAKFVDCEPYTEPIKSPNTISRTVLPNKIIPRIAMGTVEAPGPDHVGAPITEALPQTEPGPGAAKTGSIKREISPPAVAPRRRPASKAIGIAPSAPPARRMKAPMKTPTPSKPPRPRGTAVPTANAATTASRIPSQ